MCPCWKLGAEEKKNELDTKSWKKIIDDLNEFGIRMYVFSGGEPLLRPDLFDIGNYAREHSENVKLITNGVLINENIAKKIAKTFDRVAISLDSATPETYYKVRGTKNFYKVLNNIKLLKKYKDVSEMGINIVVLKDNYLEIPKIVELAEDLNIPVNFSIVNTIYIPNKQLEKDIDFNRLKEILKEAITHDIVSNKWYIKNIINNKIQKDKCLELFSGLDIHPNGNLVPANTCIYRKSVGNLMKTNIKNIYKSYSGLREKALKMNFKECKNCKKPVQLFNRYFLFYVLKREFLKRKIS
jgi:MoaA/NifB/PqqE/SkfB family radical SAM enzyme